MFVPFIIKLRLIPVLGAALLLAGIIVAGVQAAPPGQTPENKPSAIRGEGLWIENCAPCHGTGGRGDGPTAQMPQMADNPPTDFTDRAAARQRTPADMFAVTKEGRMDRLMPPWGGRLSDDQIWDVVAYAQTFSTSPDEIAAGEKVYQAKCLACHAADGSAAAPGVPDLADPALLAVKSSQALFDVVSNGQPPSGIGGQRTMPAFADQLSEEERWRVVDYLRTFSYEPIALDGVIVGQVQNATTGQPVGNLEVRLRRWGIQAELPSLTVQADTDGRFRFEGLDTGDHAFYTIETAYNGVLFPSDFVGFEPGVNELSLPVNVYETTTDDQSVSVERLHFIVMGNEPGFLSVLELYQFSNSGDRAYAGTVNDQGQRETVQIALPAGAQNVSLQSGALGVDFLQTDAGLVSTSVVVPGQETFEVAFVYAVPYSGESLSLDRVLYYDTTAVNGLLLDMGAKLESEVLTFGGERAAQGQTFLQYTAQDLKAGETLPIRLSDLDKMEFAATAPETSESSSTVMPSTGLKQSTLLWMMLGLGALAVVLGVSYPRLRGERIAPEGDLARERQRLLLTLASLDEAFESGQLNETVYRRVRARRKAELAEVFRRLQGEL